MPTYEDLWNEIALKEEIKQFLGEFDPLLWSLDAQTDTELEDTLSNDGTLEDFYRETIGFIYQSAWNAATNQEKEKYLAMVNVINNRNHKNIFDYGCAIGSGIISFALKTNASKIVGADICLPSLNFLNKRIENYGLEKNRVVTRDLIVKPLKPEIEKYDCIVCTEVLEHVKEPIKLAKDIYDSLVPGGSFIASWSFVPMPTHLPEHFHMQASHPDKLLTEGFGKIMAEEIGFRFECFTWFNNMHWTK